MGGFHGQGGVGCWKGSLWGGIRVRVRDRETQSIKLVWGMRDVVCQQTSRVMLGAEG